MSNERNLLACLKVQNIHFNSIFADIFVQIFVTTQHADCLLIYSEFPGLMNTAGINILDFSIFDLSKRTR